MAENYDERTLIMKAIEGDEISFETLILSCKGKAYNLAFRYMKNEGDAMDALQESFIKIYRNLSSFNFQSKFDTWVYRVVVNTCNDMLRKNRNQALGSNILSLYGGNSEDDEYEFEIPDKADTPEESYEKKESSQYILDCLEKLPYQHREIIILRDIRSFSYEEIAEILDCSIGTVKSRISRARIKLRDVYVNGNYNSD